MPDDAKASQPKGLRSAYAVGFFGVPNLGDELLALCVTRRLRERWGARDVRVMVMSEEVARAYAGLRDVMLVEGFCPTPEYLRNICTHVSAIRRADVMTIGGGALIADAYTWTSILRYGVQAIWAVLLGKPYVFVGLGVSQIRRRWLRPIARFALKHAACVYVRDEKSAEQAERFIGSRQRIVVAPTSETCINQDSVTVRVGTR